MISDILDYSQSLNQKVLLTLESRPLREVIEYCYQLLEYAFNAKGLLFELVVDKTLPVLFRTDHDRLSQVILNLLSNSIKFTMNGSISIKVECVNEVDARISVKDTGIGMKDDDIRKLFEDNNQSSDKIFDEKERHSQGVGLGLKIANKLVKLLESNDKQEIQVESKWEVGSKFSFIIKNHTAHVAEAPISSLPSNVFDAQPDSNMICLTRVPTDNFGEEELMLKKDVEVYFKPMKTLSDIRRNSQQVFSPSMLKTLEVLPQVLIVDDDPFNILSLQSLLGQLRLSFESANNGQKAVEKVIENPKAFQLIIMDCQMPIMNGYEAARLLTKMMRDEELPVIPIIGCTAFTAKDKLEECIKSGMIEVINKPVMFTRLQEIISKLLKR